jgi:hypothetical protein
MEAFLDRVRNLTHPVHLLLYDNTQDSGKYCKKLKNMTPEPWITVKRHHWNPKKTHPLQMLAHIKERGRKEFLIGNYDYYWDLATDMIPPKDIIERYIKHNKDCVGGKVHIFPGKLKEPAIIPWRGNVKDSGHFSKDGGMDLMTWSELRRHRGLVRVYGIGAPFMKRKVLKKVPWRTHDTLLYGEDLWFFHEANESGFEFWCDTDVEIKHNNTDWGDVPIKREMAIFFAIGPENASGVDFYGGAGETDKPIEVEPPEINNL